MSKGFWPRWVALLGATLAALVWLVPVAGRAAFLGLVAVLVLLVLALWRWGGRWRVPTWAELVLLTAVMLLATTILRVASVDWQIGGREMAYLTNSGVVAGDMWRNFGGVPLWNPLMGYGEPLVENPFSFVLNPLMSVPFLLLDRVTAVKAALTVHVVLAAWGGYAWGRAVGLGAVGRLVLGVLLGGAGSMAGLLAEGFYQMACSLAYVPWVFAGLYGVLGATGRARRRWGGVLVLAAVLMLLAGTFWYVLPTMVSAALVAGVALAGPLPDRRGALVHLALATGLVLLVSAVRMLPGVVHAGYVDHPEIYMDGTRLSGWAVAARLVNGDTSVPEQTYHYILPAELALWLVLGRALVGAGRPLRPRLVLVGLALAAFYTLWAAEGGAVSRWLYTHIAFIDHWRFPQRMQAAAVPWVALVAALWADDVARWLAAGGGRWAGRLLRALVVVLLARAAVDVLLNWERLTPVREATTLISASMTALREQHPSALVAVATPHFRDYDALLANRLRATLGNPDYHPLWLPLTLGALPPELDRLRYHTRAMGLHRYLTARYATDGRTFLTVYEGFDEAGYVRVPTPPAYDFSWWVWARAGTAPYAFAGHEATLAALDHLPGAADAAYALDYWHGMDRVTVAVPALAEPSVVVVHETAYPGWRVTVNGAPRPLEVVAGYVAVRVAPGDTPATVRFVYRPRWLFGGFGLTLVGAVLLVVYLHPRRDKTPTGTPAR